MTTDAPSYPFYSLPLKINWPVPLRNNISENEDPEPMIRETIHVTHTGTTSPSLKIFSPHIMTKKVSLYLFSELLEVGFNSSTKPLL